MKLFESIRTQIIMILFAFLIPLNLMLILLSSYSTDLLENQSINLIESKLAIQMSQLDNTIAEAERYLAFLANSNPDLQLYSEDATYNVRVFRRVNVWKELNQLLVYSNRIFGFYLMDAREGQILLAVHSSTIDHRQSLREYISLRIGEDLPNRWYLAEIQNSTYMLRWINENGVYLGALVNVDEYMSTSDDSISTSLVLSTQPDIPVDRGQLMVSVQSASKDLYLHQMISKSDLLGSLPFIQAAIYLLIACCIIALPSMFFLIRRILLEPLKTVNNALNTIEAGNMDYRIPPQNSAYEFRRLNSALNNMTHQIQSLKIDNYEQQIEKQQVEYQNLLLQVNPHFLVNSFNLIYQLAQIQDYQAVQRFTVYLSDYFRYSLNTHELVDLEKELAMVETYLNVSQMRFPNMFTAKYFIEEDLDRQQIPPMLLVGFVENIIKYTLQRGRIVHIFISAKRAGDCVVLSVADDGEGIDPQIMKLIADGEKVVMDGREHIGIWNSRQRLRLQYGERAKLMVESKPGEGVRVRISLPVSLDE